MNTTMTQMKSDPNVGYMTHWAFSDDCVILIVARIDDGFYWGTWWRQGEFVSARAIPEETIGMWRKRDERE